jgi:aspartate 1-decarboxylase
MLLEICTSKIHRATVTEADLDYVGSITIDENLMKAAGLREFQKVTITSLANGTLWYTYVMKGAAGSGTICLNGPPAHHFKKGEIVIILAYALVTPEEFGTVEPVVVFVDGANKITKIQKHTDIGK